MDENANELMWIQYNSLVLITWKYKCTLLVFDRPKLSECYNFSYWCKI